MKVRHFLSIADIGQAAINRLVERSLEFAQGQVGRPPSLEEKVVGIYFKKTSTRTRTSFSVGALKLGARTIHYGPNDLQIETGETISDTARVLSGYIDMLVVRTNESIQEMLEFAGQDQMAVINAMSNNEHPTQAVADLVTIREAFGRLDVLHVLYIGEGNNTAAALALAISQIPGMALTVVTPEGYGLPEEALARSQSVAKSSGAFIDQHHRMDKLPRRVDVVYTTRWQTMGVPKPDENWRERFEPFRITEEVMAEVAKPSKTIFLHDLPAVRGSEVVNEVLDGPQSLAFRQARHKLTSAMSIMEWCLADN
jgi:ornithine carbamoyltransferase